jgi:hypothetical protein
VASPLDRVLGRESDLPTVDEPDTSVSFAELVWAARGSRGPLHVAIHLLARQEPFAFD